MHRFYADGRTEDLFTFSAGDARHADTVLRLKRGDAIEVFYAAQRYSASIESLSDAAMTARCLSPLPDCEPSLQVTLFQGLPKGEKMEWIIQKAVELGVDTIVPVEMRRSVVRLNRDAAEKKQARWQKIAREAGKQSGRAAEVPVELPLSFAGLCERLRTFDVAAAFIMMAGVLITAPSFSLQSEAAAGLLWGMLSSLSYAVLSMINRRFAGRYSGRQICLYEQIMQQSL